MFDDDFCQARLIPVRVGKLELRVPQDRQGRFRTEVFERYQRSEKALVGALAEMYVQGVSTRKVKAITEELWPRVFGFFDQPGSTRTAIKMGLNSKGRLTRNICKQCLRTEILV